MGQNQVLRMKAQFFKLKMHKTRLNYLQWRSRYFIFPNGF